MNLTSENVNKIFMDCLFKDEEIDGKDMADIKFIPAEGIISNVGFHPERLESHRKEVTDMVNQLPDKFKPNLGGGYTFMNMPFDKNDHQWGEQRNAEQLLQLGIGLGIMKILMPRSMWNVFPGGVPYVAII